MPAINASAIPYFEAANMADYDPDTIRDTDWGGFSVLTAVADA
jgi:hypothetical protein